MKSEKNVNCTETVSDWGEDIDDILDENADSCTEKYGTLWYVYVTSDNKINALRVTKENVDIIIFSLMRNFN